MPVIVIMLNLTPFYNTQNIQQETFHYMFYLGIIVALWENQCMWIARVNLTQELISPVACHKVMDCLP